MNWKSLFVLFTYVTLFLNTTHGQSLDSLLLDWKNSKVPKPGVAITAIKGDQVVLEQFVGYENLESNRLITSKTIFDLASLSKQFTGFATAKLMIDGKLHLDDPVKSYLPELSDLNDDLKIKHLVYHTSGLKEVEEEFSLGDHACTYTTKEALAILSQHKLKSKPGKKYQYTNTNYLLLAIIVEQITDTTLQSWLEENLFQPLKMNHSFVNLNPCDKIEHQAIAYYEESETFIAKAPIGMSMIGSSSVYSNMEDMTKWMLALQNESQFPAVFRLMKKKGTLDNGEELNYGFGLSIIINPSNLLVINHMGFTRTGFRTLIASFPEEQYSFVVLTNSGNINPDQFSSAIINYCKAK